MDGGSGMRMVGAAIMAHFDTWLAGRGGRGEQEQRRTKKSRGNSGREDPGHSVVCYAKK